MKAQAHLHKLLTALAAHHATMGKAHEAMMGEHEENSADHKFHKAAVASHAEAGEQCVSACKTLMGSNKAAGFDSDALEPLPTGLSVVTPDAPAFTRAIPRFGQREISKADVPQEFRKLIVVDEEE